MASYASRAPRPARAPSVRPETDVPGSPATPACFILEHKRRVCSTLERRPGRADAVEQIRWAHGRGVKILAETCPQYLVLTADRLHVPGFEGAKYICSPPPRDEASQQAVWQGLASGVFQVVSSDHAAFRFDDPEGKKRHGVGASFTQVPNGIPGVETRMPLLFSEGVGKGRIDLRTFVALTATNAARIYGLFPRKGTIAVGSDADVVVWDQDREVVITSDLLHSACDYTPYEGMRVRGWPTVVFSRGEVVFEEGKLLVTPGRGQFLRCGRPSSLPA